MYLEIRSFKHDYINLLSSFEGFLIEQDYEKLEAFFYKHIYPTGTQLAKEDSSIGTLLNITIPEIKGLLSTKLFIAFRNSLSVTLDIPRKINSFDIDTVSLVRILGVLLDNAIEAALLTNDKILYIGIFDLLDEITIHIRNSSIEILDVELLFDINATSKGNTHGVGLYSVRKIIEKTSSIFLHTSYQNGLFSQELQVIKNRKECH